MRYVELLVTDLAESAVPNTWTEWIARDHIGTIEPYTTGRASHLTLWLQVTLTSGRKRYVPLGAVDPDQVDDAARRSITALLEFGAHPVRAAGRDSEIDAS